MEINRETITHLADLSEISLTESESESLEHDLTGIVKYISQISELDTADVEPTYQVFEMVNVWRDDVILEQDATREQLLALSKEQQDSQVKVPKVL
ncbi:Asp-tRNA(Asn)/Glu-tRNA(Gln) amidotransferase subunit GatC [Candidatus Saccharibacteria bacterium]|nr:Asp-tRNA(Asn)/Glu-tRNA(Gln) amidotransferase subunit GatC [Candidatus Saccharibacteria bacterium]